MKIWTIKISENIPTDDKNVRLTRMALINQILVERGHQVTWWNSTMDHFQRKQRFKCNHDIVVNENYIIKLIYAIGYKKRLSFARFFHYWSVARKFSKLLSMQEQPDIIFCALPSIELAYYAVKYARKKNIPIVIDVRDMWPDIFVFRSPTLLKPIMRLLTMPSFKQMYYVCQNATAIYSITEPFLEWALTYSKRNISEQDKVFPLAYPVFNLNHVAIASEYEFWNELGVKKSGNNLVICYIGTIRPQAELSELIDFFIKYSIQHTLVIAGNGDELPELKAKAKNNKNIIFSGWINKNQIYALMQLADLGIAPYRNTPDVLLSIPNKPIEYFSAGLPVLTTLSGYLQYIIEKFQVGVIYKQGDELAMILENLNSNRSKLEFLSNNAKNLYEEKFKVSNVYAKLVDALEALQITNNDESKLF
jgi:glycosyltransferase involved in cell wall biosynthesis